MCRISNYRSKRVIYFWPISVNYHWAIFVPIIISRHSRWIISKRLLRSSCAVIQPFVQRRVVMLSARPAAADNSRESCSSGLLSRRTPLCLFARRSGSPIALEFGQLFNRLYDFFEPHSFLCFPLFWGNSFIDRLSTAFVSDTFTMIPCMLYMLGIFDWWAKYCVDGLFTSSELLSKLTVHKLNFVHESSRFSSCSTEQLWIVSPQPRTPTRRRQSIDVYDCGNRRHRRVLDEGSSRFVRIASVNVFYAGCLYVHLTLTLTYQSIIFWAQIDNDFSLIYRYGAPKFLTLTKSMIGICLSVFIYYYQNYLWLHCNLIIWLIV